MKWSYALAAFLALSLVPVWLQGSILGSGSVGILPPQVLPPQIFLSLFPGATGSYQMKIHNGNGQAITIYLSIIFSKVPPHGSATDIQLNYPRTFVAGTGNTVITVGVRISQSAAPGTYVLNNTITF